MYIYLINTAVQTVEPLIKRGLSFVWLKKFVPHEKDSGCSSPWEITHGRWVKNKGESCLPGLIGFIVKSPVDKCCASQAAK